VSAGFDDAYAGEQLRRSRHPLRRLVKGFYLRNILREVSGPAIDFGCGAGQLLERLPAGSIGLEVNPALVRALQARQLNAVQYDAAADNLALSGLQPGCYSTFVMAHVLEHFDDAARALRSLLAACRRLDVHRFILVVSGWKGYQSDATHRTFVDLAYLEREGLLSCEGYALQTARHFPLDVEALGRHFVFHELTAVFQRHGAGSVP
jgi:SAM-dependent methyltransferase